MKLIGTNILYQANFPKSRGSLLSSVYYTIYNADGSIYTAKTQSGVVELGTGSYGVVLAFSIAGNWSIFWEIENTPYVASTEINIYDDSIVYDSYGL